MSNTTYISVRQFTAIELAGFFLFVAVCIMNIIIIQLAKCFNTILHHVIIINSSGIDTESYSSVNYTLFHYVTVELPAVLPDQLHIFWSDIHIYHPAAPESCPESTQVTS